jgi:hypothetical protein
MREEPVIRAADPELLERDEHSMKLLEYGLAIVAVLAAVLLAIVR